MPDAGRVQSPGPLVTQSSDPDAVVMNCLVVIQHDGIACMGRRLVVKGWRI